MDEPSAVLFARELAKRSRRDHPHANQTAAAAASTSAAAATPPRAARTVPLVPVLRAMMHGVEQPTQLQPARTSFTPSPPPAAAAAAAPATPAPATDSAAMTDIPGDSASSAAAAASSTAAPAAPSSVDQASRCLVQLPAQPDACTQECTRKVCCASVPCPPSASSVDVYWSRHQTENEHFEAPQSEVDRQLRAQLRAVDDELQELTKRKQKVDHHINVLHSYNEIKDVVQSLMGKCAELEGKRITEMYEKFGLELDD